RKELMKYLKERGIATRIYFDAVHKYSIFKNLGYENISLPKTEKLCSQVLTLPIYPHMARDEMDYIIESIKEFFR
ncbi:MAG: DegT/DnrJ/EryC1/StrS family aminotransferase, partial [Candidatus Bathyarchaeota archaeon]|nr:DegT/DnrJ/EryC1/StrS family aminotransferase [Candidatus Bathyarchaeota archaeon]